MISQLRRYNIALDTWRADWFDRFQPSDRVGNYPQKGAGLHYYFAKLYLCSHAFRGISKSASTTYTMPQAMVEIAEAAVASAIYILRTINTDIELQSYLSGLPLSFDTMIAFAAVFLLKISTEYSGIIQVDTGEMLSLIHQNMVVLEEVGSKLKSKHLLIRISEGIRGLVERYSRVANDQPPSEARSTQDTNMQMLPMQSDPGETQLENDMNWAQGDFSGFGLECFDLLEPSTQPTYPFTEPWLGGPGFQQGVPDPW
jgi:hypothetical protein